MSEAGEKSSADAIRARARLEADIGRGVHDLYWRFNGEGMSVGVRELIAALARKAELHGVEPGAYEDNWGPV